MAFIDDVNRQPDVRTWRYKSTMQPDAIGKLFREHSTSPVLIKFPDLFLEARLFMQVDRLAADVVSRQLRQVTPPPGRAARESLVPEGQDLAGARRRRQKY